MEQEHTKEKAKENLSKLVEKFERESNAGKIKDYNEEATKTAFIQPLLKDVLGWDVTDRDEVSPEEKTSHGRVDYGLKVEGRVKIFVEAKPPRADLKKHVVQAVRYGYNRKGVPFVLLTDFEELYLFDVTIKPDSRNLFKGLKIDLQWNKYLEQFEKLWLLSKESAVSGSMDKLLLVKAKDRLLVDKAILDDLKRWHEALAKDIYKNNPDLFHSADSQKDADYLKEITQKILDRIIFMRSCEDRKIVHRTSLKELFEERTESVGKNTMVFLSHEFMHYNINFDSDLFRPQSWEKQLAIDFRVMREIILDTYNPYQFDVIPLEVLGNIYEQYLGYTIRLTDHQVKYELKADVRKAGGVYYTPEYIVDYIVENTVGTLLKESSTVRARELRILDPACGSGSFLIRAYEEMLDYYTGLKRKGALRSKKRSVRQLHPMLKTDNGEIVEQPTESALTLHEKAQVLLNHIYGVDIDEQAVEVTKLSLMLKMLEGEHGFVLGRHILPMLDKNIRCGNSLISGDTLELKKYFGDEWYKVKPFNWEDAFRKIMVEEGGFDAVIGNPPYVRQEMLGERKEYFQKHYKAYHGKADLYAYFIERGVSLLKKEVGSFSNIVANKWMRATYGEPLRRWLCEQRIKEIIDFRDLPVFEGATTYPCIIRLCKGSPDKNARFPVTQVKALNFDSLEDVVRRNHYLLKIANLNKNSWSLAGESAQSIFAKVHKAGIPLGEYVNGKIYYGIKTGLNEAFIIDSETKKRIITEDPKSSVLIKPFLMGRDIRRYERSVSNKYLILIKKGWTLEQSGTVRDKWGWFKRKYSTIANYLQPFASDAEKRYDKGDYWWELRACDYYTEFEKPKIFLPDISLRGNFTIDAKGEYYCINTAYVISSAEKYLLGILNSSIMTFYYKNLSSAYRGGYLRFIYQYLIQLPIRQINFTNSVDKKLHDDLVALVEVMLDLNKKIPSVKGSERDQIQRQIDKTDKEIDELVYKLYGITEEERKMIEGEE